MADPVDETKWADEIKPAGFLGTLPAGMLFMLWAVVAPISDRLSDCWRESLLISA